MSQYAQRALPCFAGWSLCVLVQGATLPRNPLVAPRYRGFKFPPQQVAAMEEKREKVIKIRVSAEEFETLKFNSTKIQLAEWMRETCLNPGQGDLVRDLVQPEPVDPALLRALAGIGNNMNQIARRINTGEWDSLDVVKIVAALGAIERELAELRALHR